IPTCVEPTRYSLATHDHAGPLRLVWLGSSSTLRGLEQSRALWSGLAQRLPSLRLRLVCDRFAAFSPMPVETIAWSDSTAAGELAASDVGIAWMPKDNWSRGKCGLKVLQYQAAGLPVVANPVGLHNQLIREGKTGYLANSL